MYTLLSLSIENYRSFYVRQELPFPDESKYSITALFGPNASGKSNVAKALATVLNCIRNSASANWTLPYDPFILKTGSDIEPCRFSINFMHDKKRYTYEFAYNASKIVYERLREQSENTTKMRTIFERDADGNLGPSAAKFGFGKTLIARTRPETLIITKGHEDNNTYSNIVFGFTDSVSIISPGPNELSPMFVEMLKDNPDLRNKTIELLQECDFSIRDIQIESVKLSETVLEALPISSNVKKAILENGGNSFKTVHAVRDEERSLVSTHEMDFWTQESEGTRNFFEVAVPIIDALDNGKTIFIDEFGAYIHPTLAEDILRKFRERSENSARLVLTTHGTSMLKSLLRDEIVLVEKNMAEETMISSLSSLGARENEAFEKRYLAGLYGAIPLVNR